jgi:CubicO group peptidase (beta-lactamase class C family)
MRFLVTRSFFVRFAALALALGSTGAAQLAAADYVTPRFTDSSRLERVRAARPEIDGIFADFARERHAPGLVWGIVLDGELIHLGALGFSNLDAKTPAAARTTRFRIASMTKSVTALAILKLRDAGKLTLDDPVARHIPDFAAVKSLTSDAPPITIRHLLVMSAGFPEDNPWGDRQLAVSVEQFLAFLRGGVALSNSAGVAFEYSNLGYALLGQIVTQVAREPYQRYITREILQPLGMLDTVWEFTAVPREHLALGYRWENGTWSTEPLLHDGTYGAMGGLLTTIPDFARYAALHLAAWPARDGPDAGPVKRATLREMHKPGEVSVVNPAPKTLSGELNPHAVGYGFGLRWTLDSRRVVSVGHSGGLPGFGSNWTFFPEHGFAILSFANLTYAGTSAANTKVAALLLEKLALTARVIPASAVLQRRKEEVATLVQSWDAELGTQIAAENFFLDRTRDSWIAHVREVFASAGAVKSIGEIVPENQLRGTFPIATENGRIDVFFTLTPEKNPKLQQLRLTFVPKSPRS